MTEWYPEGEAFAELNAMNRMLLPVEARLQEDAPSVPRLPQVFVVGPPRSASTVTYQLIAHHGGFGYISNLLARFWMVPSVGRQIERGLGVTASAGPSEYQNLYGRTTAWHEPHEFGYWFNRWFDQGQTSNSLDEEQLALIDRDAFRSAVAALEHALDAPVVFGNNSWCTYHVPFLAEALPKSVFVVCERDPLYIAQSILQAREKNTGSRDAWWSMRPRAFPDLERRPWWEQIAGQVFHTIKEQEQGLSEVPAERIVRFPYQALCADPRTHLRRLAEAVNALGADVPLAGQVPAKLEPTDRQRVDDDDFNRLKDGIRTFFGDITTLDRT